MQAALQPNARFDMYYETFDRFAVNLREADGNVQVVFLLRRDGVFGWKLRPSVSLFEMRPHFREA